MDQHIEKDLINTYNLWVKCFMEDALIDQFDVIASPKIMGYGTTSEEKVFGIDEVKALCLLGHEQRQHLKDYNYSLEIVSKQYSNLEKCAVIVAEIDLGYTYDTIKTAFKLRISTVLFHEDGRWKIVHWHGSVPVETEEGDTWHAEEWKRENLRLQEKVDAQTAELRDSLEELKATQAQLIQSEKLASLGHLAAGIAHEIKNPMNFINNFSELSLEYVDELKEALEKLEQNDTTADMNDLLNDVAENLKKVHHHGTRADNIVKSMLMHSRGGNGTMEPTDLNELIKEYVNLAFHGMRAGKAAINVTIDLNLDDTIGDVSLNTEDFSRVILNLCKNAFDAMRTKSLSTSDKNYQPVLSIRTYKDESQVVHVEIQDNGPGVPDTIKEKLFQPFFTTKKGTEGTGLGLSITHDIITKHKGSIEVTSEEHHFTRFHIYLPQNQK
ncbi:ATP-binding protein [Paucihalobacter sp.]|uniref:ATP-binding protein n=1 Tax=Paucihalobacter sp. TaxID=2850405 RepID=UPI002FE125D9